MLNVSYDNTSQPNWLQQIFEDDAAGLTHMKDVCELMPIDYRTLVWKLCSELIGREAACRAGVAGQACRLVERYRAAYFQRFREENPGVQLEQTEHQIQHMALVVGVSIMLAAKMQDPGTRLNVNLLMTTIKSHGGSNYTIQQIQQVEQEVFSMIGCRIPSSTNVQRVEMFVNELRLGDAEEKIAGIMMNIVEYQLPTVLQASRAVALAAIPNPTTEFEKICVRYLSEEYYIDTADLLAGVVLAATRWTGWTGPEVVTTLASWTRCRTDYLDWLADGFYLLIEHLLEEDGKTEE